jgi:D-alanyl-D-alanine carboxypeptidase/D-alanyl-D-alanine-endopeptidase (penicillin-binding protein 4)
MTRPAKNMIQRILVAIFALSLALPAFAQTSKSPLLQDIQIQSADTRPKVVGQPVSAPTPLPKAASTPLVTKTTSSVPLNPSGMRTLFPALAEVQVPGYSGILIESLDGNVVVESNPNFTFNPASNVKIATAFAVLKTFGPEFRFATNVYTDGAIDRTTGVLNGNLYVSGKDPMFGSQHAVALAYELNRLGIRSVSGDLVVTDNFVMNYSGSPQASASALAATMDLNRRSAAATKSWLSHLSYSGRYTQISGVPAVSFSGSSYVQPIPNSLQLLFTHESTPMREMLKAILCYSNNFLSERLGDLVGGPYAVARIVQQQAGVPPQEFSLATSSGLGYNRVTPNSMMKLLRALRNDLARYKMTFADIMPVAGIDKGTLEGRFDTDFARGSVVGKTGTLPNTDGGVSSLAGEMNTRNGRLLFVIFNMKGGVQRFRGFQNSYVTLVQGQFGGAAPMTYDVQSLETRLARSRVTYPGSAAYGND